MTIPAPRIPLCDRCVGVSAPGDPPPLSWRTLLINRCSSLPAAPPPPTGLENGSMASVSSPSSASSSSGSSFADLRRGSWVPAVSDCWALGCDANRLRALITPKLARRIGDLLATGHGQRRGRRIGAGGEIEVDQRSNGIRQQSVVRRKSPVAFDGQVPLGQRGSPNKLPNDIGLEASACEQRCLHGHRFELPTRALGGVDENGDAVRPSGFAAVARRHRDGATGQRRRQQPKPLWTVIIDRRRARLHGTSLIDQISVPP